MSIYRPLPDVMVAPNGARLTSAQHSAVPVAIPDIVATAQACAAVGAGGIHAHVRDARQNHILDSGLYLELMAELNRVLPADFYIQITSESVGMYAPEDQRSVMRAVAPPALSFAVKEMLRDGITTDVKTFYHDMLEQGCMIQHILYSAEDVTVLTDLVSLGVVPKGPISVLCVLGRYAANGSSRPEDLQPYLTPIKQLSDMAHHPVDWACCAFGPAETACLLEAKKFGGKVRIGFENNTLNANGSIAVDNAERVQEFIDQIRKHKVF